MSEPHVERGVPPLAHPLDQPAPGPAGRVPDDREQQLH